MSRLVQALVASSHSIPSPGSSACFAFVFAFRAAFCARPRAFRRVPLSDVLSGVILTTFAGGLAPGVAVVHGVRPTDLLVPFFIPPFNSFADRLWDRAALDPLAFFFVVAFGRCRRSSIMK